MKKIMFFDIDGTLIPEGQTLAPESAVRALRFAHEQGHLLFVCTGRPAVVVGDNVTNLGFDGYIMGCGTHIVIDGREELYRTCDETTCADIVRLVRECNCSPMYERCDGVFFDKSARELAMVSGIKEGFIIVNGADLDRTVDDPAFGFDKFVICYDDQSDIERFKRGIEGKFDFIDRSPGFAEMVPCGFSKGTGIETVLSHYGIGKPQAYALGDSLNDLPMKDAVGTFISMGNGKKLIPYADYVTDDIDSDGVYNAMERFGFFDKA